MKGGKRKMKDEREKWKVEEKRQEWKKKEKNEKWRGKRKMKGGGEMMIKDEQEK